MNYLFTRLNPFIRYKISGAIDINHNALQSLILLGILITMAVK